MEKNIGIRALKQNPTRAIADAVAGDVTVITDRGRPVARVVPLGASRAEDLISSGRLRPAKTTLADVPQPRARRRVERPLGDVLADMRDDERF